MELGRFYYSLLWLVLAVTPLFSQPEIPLQLKTDWQEGELTLHIAYPVKKLAKKSLYPKARYDAEEVIYSQLPVLAFQATRNVLIDSSHFLGDYYLSDPGKREKLNQCFLAAFLVNSVFSSDLATIILDYTFALYGEQGLGAVFIEHNTPFPMGRRLGARPAAVFTGIVIYARGAYELHGKQGKGKAVPALFPILYDEQMNVVLEKEMCSPVTLKKWGMIAISDKTDLNPYLERIGTFPCRMMIRKIYGVYNADLIIASSDAAILLSSPENRSLLSQGKVLIIYDPLPGQEVPVGEALPGNSPGNSPTAF